MPLGDDLFNETAPGLPTTLGKKGRRGDTLVAHITPEQAKLLAARPEEGPVTRNPSTNLLEFTEEEEDPGGQDFADTSFNYGDGTAGVSYDAESGTYIVDGQQSPHGSGITTRSQLDEFDEQQQQQADDEAYLRTRGYTKGLDEYHKLDSHVKDYIDNKENAEIPWWADDIEDEARQMFNVFVNQALERGINDEGQLNALIDAAFANGSMNRGVIGGDPFGEYTDAAQRATEKRMATATQPPAGVDIDRTRQAFPSLAFADVDTASQDWGKADTSGTATDEGITRDDLDAGVLGDVFGSNFGGKSQRELETWEDTPEIGDFLYTEDDLAQTSRSDPPGAYPSGPGVSRRGELEMQKSIADVLGSDFASTQSLLDALLSGDIENQSLSKTLSRHFPEMLMSGARGPIGGVSLIAQLFGSAMGKDVIGIYTDPMTGIAHSVHEDGTVSILSPEDQRGFDRTPDSNEPTPFSGGRPQFANNNIGGGGFNANSYLEDLIASTTAGTTNPGIGNTYFESLIREGINSRAGALGDSPTQGQLEGAFNTDFLGQGILDEETNRLRDVGRSSIGKAFPGNAFTLDQSIIDSIVQERAQPAREAVSKQLARGNFNITGGRTANQAISRQTPDITKRVTDIGQSVLGSSQRDVDAIRDSANLSVNRFNLGEDLFDILPFAQQRSNIIGDRTSTFGTDVGTAIGSDPLFNMTGALGEGGRSQGLVSGTGGSSNLLDVIAARESSGSRTQRGLGSKGSGAF